MMIADHEQQKTTKPCLLCVLKFIVKGPDTSQTELGAKGQKREQENVLAGSEILTNYVPFMERD